MTPLMAIENLGFTVSLFGNSFKVEPASKLTTSQREFLKLHKAEIVNELHGKVEWQEYTEPQPGELVVTCYTPNGKAIEVQAASPEHAEWLKRMNPKPTAQTGKV